MQVLICGINWVVLKKSEAIIDPSIFCNFRSAFVSSEHTIPKAYKHIANSTGSRQMACITSFLFLRLVHVVLQVSNRLGLLLAIPQERRQEDMQGWHGHWILGSNR